MATEAGLGAGGARWDGSLLEVSWGVCRGRFAYKDEYEKFKLYLTIILLLGAVACRFVLHYR